MTDHPQSFFTPAQRRIIASAVTVLSVLVLAMAVVLAVRFVALGLGKFASLLFPLALAGIAALILRPYVRKLERTLHFTPIQAIALIYGVFVLVVTVVLLVVVPVAVAQATEFVQMFPQVLERLSDRIQLLQQDPRFARYLGHVDVDRITGAIGANAQTLATTLFSLVTGTGQHVVSFFSFLAGLAVVPVYLFYFLRSDDVPTEHLPRLLPFLKDETRQVVTDLAGKFISINVSFFRGQILIGMITGVLYATGFSLGGLAAGIFIGLMVGFLNIVPYLGAIIGTLIVVPTALFQNDGGWPVILKCGAAVAVSQLLVDYYFTPKIMGKETGLHPVMIIVSIFFWGIALDGILGMMLGIPLTAFFVALWAVLKDKYIKPVI